MGPLWDTEYHSQIFIPERMFCQYGGDAEKRGKIKDTREEVNYEVTVMASTTFTELVTQRMEKTGVIYFVNNNKPVTILSYIY